MKKSHHNLSLIRRPGRRGFTLTELMISIAISSLVMVGVMSVQWISGRGIKEMYGQTRTRSSRMRGLDQIRYKLIEAKIGSVVLSQPNSAGTAYHRIEFKDPRLGGVTSTFYFNSTTNTLYYDDDIAGGGAAYSVVLGPIDITFKTESAGAIVDLYIKTSATMVMGDVDIQDGETAIYLRNS